MQRSEIEKRLAELFIERYSVDFSQNSEMKLLSKSGIPARELLHIYFDVKGVFDISIPEEDILKGRFDTFEHIVDIVCEQMVS